MRYKDKIKNIENKLRIGIEPELAHIIYTDHDTKEVIFESLTPCNDAETDEKYFQKEAEKVFTIPKEYWKIHDRGASASLPREHAV